MHNQPVEDIGFYLTENFSMLSLAATLEPLRMANRLSNQQLYKWYFCCAADKPVSCSNGLPFSPSLNMADATRLDRLLVVAGIDAHQLEDEALYTWLRKISRLRIPVGATSTGSLLLAKAGLLKEHACTIHWENIASFREDFPALKVTDELFEIDNRHMTCSGGLAGLDMMLQLISYKHGEKLATGVAEQCIHPNIRSAHEQQRMAVQLRHKLSHPRLVKAIELMRKHIEEHLTCQEIGSQVGLSRRQLERLFQEHLQCTPAGHYMTIRLERARHLLQQSTLSILQVANACGFTSASYFARCYKKSFSCSPKAERSR
ncbi:MAG: GlxA family transcriptional regulator [Oceanospirillaceae bacterium]